MPGNSEMRVLKIKTKRKTEQNRFCSKSKCSKSKFILHFRDFCLKMTIISGKQPQGKFIFKKQNKIRWKRSPISGDHELLQSGSLFVSGSWDDFVS